MKRMESLLVVSFHFFIMGSLVILISGIISFFIKKVHFIFTVLLSMLAGYIYSILFEIPNLAWFAIIFNGILSIVSIGIVKIGFYAKQKEEELNR